MRNDLCDFSSCRWGKTTWNRADNEVSYCTRLCGQRIMLTPSAIFGGDSLLADKIRLFKLLQ